MTTQPRFTHDTYFKLAIALVGIVSIVFGFDTQTEDSIAGGVTAFLVWLLPK